MEHRFIWVIVFVVSVVCVIVVNVAAFVAIKRTAEAFRNSRGGGRGGPHPLPASGSVESFRGSANRKESRPVGPDKA